jgi:hypothetical protein
MNWSAFGLTVVVSMLFPFESEAAVRQCWPIVSSEVAVAATEIDAKKKALEQWRVEALKLGPGYDSWRLAADKSLKCFPRDQGYECIALGAPCIVDQAPKVPPTVPKPKGQDI